MPILIRHSETRDIEAIRALYAQPSNMAGTLQLPYPSAELWQARLGSPARGEVSLVACDGDIVVGQLGVAVCEAARRRHVANIGMAVSESARGRGVGSALLAAAIELCEGWLGVRRIELEVYTDNAAAIGLYRKHGFGIEGTALGYALRAGQYVDVHYMARLKASG